MEVIERMHYIMQEKGLKASQLASILQIDRSVISNWKNRKTDPPLKYLVLICKFLDVSLEYLLTGEEVKIHNTEEVELLSNYNSLSNYNQAKISGMIELKLHEQEEQKKQEDRHRR